MTEDRREILLAWARGEPYLINQNEQTTALDRLRDEMRGAPGEWWAAFQAVFKESDERAVHNLDMPFAALLDAGGDGLRETVAETARADLSFTNSYWDAMQDLGRQAEAYRQLGRMRTRDAFVRHAPQIPISADRWSTDVCSWLVDEQPDEAWMLGLELLEVTADESWPNLIGAFVFEDLLEQHGDAVIDRIEQEAARNARLRRALPTARWSTPDHLLERLTAAAGEYWEPRR